MKFSYYINIIDASFYARRNFLVLIPIPVIILILIHVIITHLLFLLHCIRIILFLSFKYASFFFPWTSLLLHTVSFICCLWESCNNLFCNKLSCHFIFYYKMLWEVCLKDAVWKWIKFYWFSLKQMLHWVGSSSFSLLYLTCHLFRQIFSFCFGLFFLFFFFY